MLPFLKNRDKLNSFDNFQMVKKITTNFIQEVYVKRPKKNFATNKIDVFYIGDIWSMDLLDFNDSLNSSKNYRYILVLIGKLSKFL